MSHPLVFNWDALELPRDRLGLMVVVAVVVHLLIIFGIGFGSRDADQQENVSPSIEVTLVNTQSENAPEDADYLAQANQEGGGNTDEKVRPETIFPAILPKDSVEMTSTNPPAVMAPPPTPARSEVVTVARSETSINTDVVPQEKTDTQEPTAAQIISRSMDIASLEVEIGNAIQAYSDSPRRKFISANTREHKYAAYMDGWRRKVETLGNLHYPGAAQRQGLTGSLLMEVVLNADGTIRKLELKRSSGYKVLDDYALRIVRDASPFMPFPESIGAETDVLHISRTWKFLGGKNVVSR